MGHKQAQLLLKRRIAVGAVIATGLLGVGMPAASAHSTSKLEVSDRCQDDGTRLVTYTGTTSNVPRSGQNGHEGTLTAVAKKPVGSQVTPTTQTVSGNTTFTFTQTISGDAKTASATAHMVWTDGHWSNTSGEEKFKKACVPPKPAPLVEVTASYVTDCDARTVTTTTVTTTTDWKLVDNVWVKKAPVVTQEVTDRAATRQECPIIVPPRPLPVVEVTASDATDCDARTVTTTTVTTTTNWKLRRNVWVKKAPVVTQDVTTRDATVEECPIIVPEKPAPLVEVTDPETTDCDARTVTTTTVTTTTDWELVDNVWVKQAPVVTQDVTTRDATVQECPIIVPEKPAPLVEVTESETTDCDADEVTTTTTTATTDWVLDVEENEWVEGIPPEVTEDVTTQEATVQECPIIVLGVSAVAPAIVAPVQAAANPLPVGASAGQVSTSGQLLAGGLTAFAAFLALGAGFVLRRRHGEV